MKPWQWSEYMARMFRQLKEKHQLIERVVSPRPRLQQRGLP